jgi:hypothetical protein
MVAGWTYTSHDRIAKMENLGLGGDALMFSAFLDASSYRHPTLLAALVLVARRIPFSLVSPALVL